ncbi:uncharacterized protein LOC125045293 [Penaeus chinensis]|uniref:uncharacterized protein LOC125045293 n=1 Tax=Penaeus chinensis TaxID=139456 RepID=UPI001FB5B995|nr:uncharacterized protein LOC125045293 [Penaeus chinensis]
MDATRQKSHSSSGRATGGSYRKRRSTGRSGWRKAEQREEAYRDRQTAYSTLTGLHFCPSVVPYSLYKNLLQENKKSVTPSPLEITASKGEAQAGTCAVTNWQLCHSITRGVSVSLRTDQHVVVRSYARVNNIARVWCLRDYRISLASVQNIPQELALLFYMENKGFNVEKQDSYELKASPRNGNEIVPVCPCQESQTNCSCRDPKEAKPQIQVLSWTSSKGWILLAVGFCFGVWMAVFFTLFALGMV